MCITLEGGVDILTTAMINSTELLSVMTALLTGVGSKGSSPRAVTVVSALPGAEPEGGRPLTAVMKLFVWVE